MHVQPYLYFGGRCEEAANFYSKALGAEIIMLSRFKDMPEPHQPGMIPPGAEEKIMHMRLKIGESTILASDGQCEGTTEFEGFSLTIVAANDAETRRFVTALSEGGKILLPIEKTFFATSFGIVADPFGISWMVYAAS